MKVMYGLKYVMRYGAIHKGMPTQGSKLYNAVMYHLSRISKPKWMRKIDQHRKDI